MPGAVNSKTIVGNIAWKFSERMLAQLVSLIVSVILARLLLPTDYGAVAMITVFITLGDCFVTDGIPTALIQKKDADQKDFSSVLFFNIGLSALIYILIFFAAPYIAAFYRMKILIPVLRVMGLRIVIAGLNSVQHAYVSRHMMFRKYFFSTLFGTVLSGGVGIALAYWGAGVWALVAQYMTNTIVDTVILWFTVKWRPICAFSWKRIRTLFRFGWKLLFEGVSNTVAGQLRSLLIGRVYTASDLANYNKGQQFPKLLVTNISAALSSVLFPAMSSIQDDSERVLTLLRKSIRVCSYVVFPMLFGLAVVARPLIELLLTAKWLDTVVYLRIFCLTSLVTVGLYPRHQALNGTGKSDVFMIEHMISRVIGLILLFATYRISVLAVALSGIASSFVMALTVMFTSKKYNGYSYKDQISDILPTLIGCVIMCVPVYCIQLLSLSDSLTLLIQILTGGIVYWAYSRVLKIEAYQYAISMIKSAITTR